MKVKKLGIHNFRHFVDLEIEFDERLNVFVGINGAGKTSILDVLAIMLSRLSGRIQSAHGTGRFFPMRIYVSATRAKREVLVTSFGKPSRFLGEHIGDNRELNNGKTLETDGSNNIGQNSKRSEKMETFTESRIRGSFKGWDSGRVFELENLQVWKQQNWFSKFSSAYRPKAIVWKDKNKFLLEVEGMDDKVEVTRVYGCQDEKKESNAKVIIKEAQ